ncbi:SDR family oxidoreductase [Corallococcus exiguus]|uniref:SDR family NAD(P)-dependent oxidoreductase n=1 Tax=Corallococcus TaxID=83461 RepID=UPI000EA11638|nr:MULTISPECIES: glucose 1-dehydrogenase [Corallococcus]NNC20000.1 SDR family oxidoreductase [Corallococcus exiguus]NRD66285.1 SDR family oxidoreductase [Corallococcus exiguus]RKH26188.1 SDR family oxidoreductase [Corallococcus sp. CA041A]RKI10457.1 SDR family oxidoreductase [Corallococcus sp. AB030]
MRLKGKTALITGGNSGIGLATARLFVAEGARVAITGRNRETLDAAVKELGANVLAVQADATDPAALEHAVAATVERFGGLDIVFANAGVAAQTPVGKTSQEAFTSVLQTNVTGVFFTVQAAAAHLKPGASIILTSSVHSELGMPGYSAYAASKGALKAMGSVLAAELAPKGIRVNVVSPGATNTPIWEKNAPTPEAFAKMERGMSATIPMGRMGRPEEIARTVLFLASDDASYVSGQDLFVDGGVNGAALGAPLFRTPERV